MLAPLLMMGGALGGARGARSADEASGFWPLVSMGAILGGTMRSPLTGIVFALELTHDINMLLPLLVAVVVAHAFTVLALRRSILTEKVAAAAIHLSREYAVDPLEILFVREVMRTNIVAVPADTTLADIAAHPYVAASAQRLYPVVDDERRLVGVVPRLVLEGWINDPGRHHDLSEVLRPNPVVAHVDEPLRAVAYRMAKKGLTRFPVVERGERRRLLGMVSLADLLEGRTRVLHSELHRERALHLHMAFPRRVRAPGRPPKETTRKRAPRAGP